MIKKLFIIGFLIVIPLFVHADMFISEIAWMGTTISANAEWIELYNNSPNPVALDGWSLSATDGSPNIGLSGTISGSGYALLERTSDDTVPNITAVTIYSGSLSNSGEHLQLKDNLGTVIDELDATNGWPGGDNTTKQTLQRRGSIWVTETPTPGTGTVINEQGSASSATTPVTTVVQKVEENNEGEVIEIKRDPVFTARMIAPSLGTAGVAVPFTVLVKEDGKRDLVSGKFEWSMGDGKFYRYHHNEPVNHIFYYPGTYTVTLAYYSNVLKTEPDSLHKKAITIIPDTITISGHTDDGGIILNNESLKEITLDDWIIKDNEKEFIFPRYTVINKDQEISISSNILGFISDQHVVLLNPSRKLVAAYSPQRQEVTKEEVDLEPSTKPQVWAKEVAPEVKNTGDLWRTNKWYFVTGIIGIGAILAYFIFRLYAERDQWL